MGERIWMIKLVISSSEKFDKISFCFIFNSLLFVKSFGSSGNPKIKTLSWPLEVKMGSLHIKLFFDWHLDKDIEKEMICNLAKMRTPSILFYSWAGSRSREEESEDIFSWPPGSRSSYTSLTSLIKVFTVISIGQNCEFCSNRILHYFPMCVCVCVS